MEFDDLLERVLTYAPVPNFFALRELKNSAIEFCEKSLSWEENLDQITFVKDQLTYDLDLPIDSALVRITEGPSLSVDLGAMTFSLDTPAYSDFTIKAALKPSYDSTSLPDYIGQMWGEQIASGALSRILVVPGVAWSNPKLAVYHFGIFESGVSRACAMRARGYGNKTLSFRPTPYLQDNIISDECDD